MGKYVVKIAGYNPEKFVVVWLDPQLPQNSFMQTTDPMSEAELRAELARRGIQSGDCDTLIQDARKNPR